MTVAIDRRRPSALADRRRAALQRAERRRSGGSRFRSRYQERVSHDPKPIGLYVVGGVTAILVMFGLVMVLSSSSVVSFHRGRSPWYQFLRQTSYAAVGTVAMFVAYRFRLSIVNQLGRVFMFLGAVFMLAPFAPGIGTTVNGARAWVSFGSWSLQPAEFVKLMLIVWGADFLTRREDELGNLRRGVWPYLFFTGVAAGIAALQSDIGTCVVIGTIGITMLLLAGAPFRPVLGVATIAGFAGFLFVRGDPEKYARLTAFLDIHGTRENEGYQVYQALISLSNGGLTGTGIGAGTGKWGYVPLAHSDFIFAIVAEEMGLLGVLGLLTLFGFLVFFAFQLALSCAHRFGFLLAAGIGCWLTVQTTINIGGVVGILPVTGLTLPFISSGGSSLIASMTAAGLLMNVARQPR